LAKTNDKHLKETVDRLFISFFLHKLQFKRLDTSTVSEHKLLKKCGAEQWQFIEIIFSYRIIFLLILNVIFFSVQLLSSKSV
jgi:hypothetical protein